MKCFQNFIYNSHFFTFMQMEGKCFKISIVVLYYIVTNLVICKSASVVNEQCEEERNVCNQKSDEDCKTKFFLYTRQNKDKPEPLHKCDSKLPSDTYFNSNNPTKLIIHGFTESRCTYGWIREIKEEFLKRDDYNVIIVDWSHYVFGSYIYAVQIMNEPATETARLIDNIKLQKDINYTSFHIVGHSLGSHFSGLVGQNTEVYRISGLDPAGPKYIGAPKDKRLDRGDAKFVDIIHTNAGRCLPYFGYPELVGDEDFYVEGGTFQLSCYNMALEALLKSDTTNAMASLVSPIICSHKQSVYYFKSSINAENKCCFLGKRCNSYRDAMANTEKCKQKCCKNGRKCSIMGLDWPLTYKTKLQEQRSYTVKVNNNCPYCTDCAHEIPKVFA